MTKKTITNIEISEAIRLHTLWLEGDKHGRKADFRGADLRGANFSGADFNGNGKQIYSLY